VIWFNQNSPDAPTRDINVRKALSFAIDRDALNKSLWQGEAPPYGSMFPGTLGIQAGPADAYDVTKAQQFLSQAGYGPGGKTLSIQLAAQIKPTVPQILQVVQAIQSYWQKIGVQAEILLTDYGTWRAKQVAKTQAPNQVEVADRFGRTDASTDSAFWSGCKGLLSMVCDPALDEIETRWINAADDDSYKAGATATDKYILEHYYGVPLVRLPALFAANDQAPAEYSIGATAGGFNILGLVWKQ